MSLSQYIHTALHLKPVQIYGRLTSRAGAVKISQPPNTATAPIGCGLDRTHSPEIRTHRASPIPFSE